MNLMLGSRNFNTWVLAGAVWLAFSASARAVFWNNDPNFGTTGGTNGLTNSVLWFPNDNVIDNTSNSTRGSSILLDSQWVLSVRHVVQNGSDYSTITSPNNIYINIGGATCYADAIYTPDGSSELSLIHLRGGDDSAMNLQPYINSSFNESGKVVEIGGYGYYGIIDTTQATGSSDVAGTSGTSANFHRAFNIASIAGNGQINIGTSGTGNTTLKMDSLVQGSAGPGDSGGPMFVYDGDSGDYFDSTAAQISDPTNWELAGLTATASALGTGNIASWGTNSNYTRVANYASWINSTIASAPQLPASTTGAWVQDSGNNLYDTGRNRISVINPNAAPVVHANFGAGGKGYTLSHVGDKITMTSTLDTTYAMASIQFRYGMFYDMNSAGQTIPGNVAGGTPWMGYLIPNSASSDPRGPYEKGPNGGGVGSWWSLVSPNSGNLVGSAVQATGSFSGSTPAGEYSLSLTYTRQLSGGLKIDWSMVQIADVTHNTTSSGVYSFTGSVIDPTPASSTWTYDELGYFLNGNANAGQVVMENINVAYAPYASSYLPGDFNLDGKVTNADVQAGLNALRNLSTYESGHHLTDGDVAAIGDLNGDNLVSMADIVQLEDRLAGGANGGSSLSAVPEPSTLALLAGSGLGLVIGLGVRPAGRKRSSERRA